MLRTDNRLPTVVRCANELRQQLHDGGSADLRVIPAIGAEMEQAERPGVAVATRETLEAAIDCTILPLQSDALFSETEKEIAETAARFTT